MTGRRVVVTGIGTINPLGNSIEEYFSNLEKGVSGAAPITHFDAEKFKTKFACEVKNYDPTQYFDRKEVRKYDLFTQYALIAATQAVEDSALDLEKVDKEQVGVIWSSGIGGIKSFFDECLGWAAGDGTPRFSPFFIPRMISDIAAGFISMKYGFMGPNYCTVSACASSNHGITAAFDAIRYGKADVMVAGGSEAAVNEPSVGGFNSMQALSTRNDDPQHASRPFDKDRDGFVIGEGAGALILEEYEHAKARGAKIYCEVVGGGASADAYHFTAPHPEGKGAMKAMRDAIKDAGIAPEDIDYVNVHGTSTPAGDIPELKAVAGVLGDHVYNVNISSTKSMTGHLLGAAGAVEALACIFALTHGVVPPTINCENRDPEIDEKLNLTLNVAQKRDVKCALSNTFGFGGHNPPVIFRKLFYLSSPLRGLLFTATYPTEIQALPGIFQPCLRSVRIHSAQRRTLQAGFDSQVSFFGFGGRPRDQQRTSGISGRRCDRGRDFGLSVHRIPRPRRGFHDPAAVEDRLAAVAQRAGREPRSGCPRDFERRHGHYPEAYLRRRLRGDDGGGLPRSGVRVRQPAVDQ